MCVEKEEAKCRTENWMYICSQFSWIGHLAKFECFPLSCFN